MMNSNKKFYRAMANLKKSVEYTYSGTPPSTEEEFNKIKWLQDNGESTTGNPHPELTWTKVKDEMDAVQSKYDGLAYARNRKKEYPSIEEAVHAILDDTLDELQIKRQAVKDKYPK